MSQGHSEILPLTVNIEYCEICNLKGHCLELANRIKNGIENAEVSCQRGRQGSFEIKINDQLVYSKLQTMALPDFDEVTSAVKTASGGGPVNVIKKEQPITCSVS